MTDAWAVGNPEGCDVCGRDACEDHLPSLPTTGSEVPSQAPLQFYTLAEVAARVRAAGPRRYLLTGWWPAGDYGVLSAEMKAQKTWTALDMAVSGASGTPFLGAIPVESPGTVLVFLGEGSEGNAWRRLSALAAERQIDAATLPIVLCTRAPHLSDPSHLALLEDKVRELQPVLVIVDPLYLAARGAEGGNLYAMGEVLEGVQHVCQRHKAALLIVHHHNRREGTGAGRMSGAGPAEWGRVLLTLDVKSRQTDPETKETTVITQLDAIGGEIPDQSLRIVRRVRAVDPLSLDSALVVSTTVDTSADYSAGDSPAAHGLPPAARKLLEALEQFPTGATPTELVDRVKQRHGHGLARETVSKMLGTLEKLGKARSTDAGAFRPKIWRSCDSCDVTCDTTPATSRVTACDLSLEGHAAESHGDGHTGPRTLDGHTVMAVKEVA